MSKMKRGWIICLLVFGLAYAAEDNVGADTQDAKTINFRFYDKNKRGTTKITNADNPAFNHLSTSNAVSGTNSVGGFKPTTTSGQTPFRYLYSQQYYQPNPYLTYVQLPHAAQIAAQYAIQSNPVAHFLQTPNQIQYVAAPTISQVPQIKYYSNEYSSAGSDSSSSSSSSSSSAAGTASSSQYVPQTQSAAASASQTYSSSDVSASTVAVPQTKQVQVPYYSSAQPLYYQQPLLYFPQAQATNFIYQQPNANYLIKQQQLASIYGNRFGLYTPTQNQLTYLVPMVVSQPEQVSTTTTSNLKSSEKTVSNAQQSASSNSYTFGSKA